MTYPAALPSPEDEIDPAGAEGMEEEPGLSEEELQSIVQSEIEHAILFIDSDIAPLRTQATNYYRGALFGDEEEGRSKVISRDVHDTAKAIAPGLMRTFFGPERIVEFVPNGPEDVEMAEQATDYVNYIVTRDNPGFLIFHALIMDSLVRKCGIVKYWWDNSITVEVATYTGLDIMALLNLEQELQQSGAEAEIIAGQMKPDGTADVRLKIKRPRDRVRIAALPSEEFIIDGMARSLDEFRLVGHRRDLPISDLIAMGYSEDELRAVGGSDNDLNFNMERIARLPMMTYRDGDIASGNESQELITYVEAFLRIDTDGDGIAELHKFCCVGPQHKILHHEIVDNHPFAEFPCDPEPHTFFGDSIAEKTMDIQKTKTGILRATLDSLALSVFPRTVVLPGATLSDVMNTEIGAVIRAKNQNDVTTLDTPFVGEKSFPMLEYMDSVRESRTGMSKVSQGLDPESLQNTTAVAAANQFGKAHEHQELIARIFAETGMKRLFRGILRLVNQNQRQARVISLRGKWVETDPRAWKADMDVTANVALGAGTDREKVSFLMQVKATQEQIMLTAGPNNPLCGVDKYYNTLAKLCALNGFKNPTTFFNDPAQRPPQAPQQPPPDPKAMAELAKQQNEAKALSLKFIMHQNDMAQKNADRDQESILKVYDINTRNKTQHDLAAIRAHAEAMRIVADLHMDAEGHKHKTADIGH